MPIALADLVFLMPPELAARVHGFIKAGGGPYSTETPTVFEDFAELVNHTRRVRPGPVLALAAVPMLNRDFEDALPQLTAHANLQVAILSENEAVHTAAQQAGLPLGLSLTDLSPQHLTDLLRLLAEWQHTKAMQRQLQTLCDQAEARFHDMADLCADWLWEVDVNLNLVFSSNRKRPSVSSTKGSNLASSFLPEEKLRIEDDFAELLRTPRPFHDRDYWSADRFGSRICWSVSGVPLTDAVGTVVGFRGVARDISSQKASTDQIYYLVNHDALTGVMNRQRVQDELTRTLRAAKRESRSGVLVVLDIDRFSYINQTHGHLVGDKYLIHLAQVLKDNVRTGDVVARLDGDTFAVLLRDVRVEDVPPRLERLQAALAARPLPTEAGALTLNVSGGAACYPKDADNADELLANAVDALTRAKQRGPRKIETYDPAATQEHVAEGHLEWVEMVNECLEAHEQRMVLYYQPIVPLSGPAIATKVEHYEVLLRLIDREGALVAPGKFMATAEEFGLVGKIDRIVTLRAIDMLKLWQSQGRKVHLSVNLSGKTFDNNEFLKVAKEAMQAANLPPKALVFEITETALLRDLQQVKAFMTELRALGAGFALDDCGVGYSSFNYIRQLELDFIKIDGSFVRNLHLNGDDQAFVKALADVAKQKNISTVAEMVEHEAAMTALQGIGIDFGQGYFFAPPQPELPAVGWEKSFVH
jgi:diguanylate cyclase (GGDEF)-like protein